MLQFIVLEKEMFRRVLIYSAVGGSVIGTALSLHGNDYNVNSLGIVRLGRSAATVFDVALTYKKHLYYKEWDTNSQEYKKQKSIVHKIAAEKLLTLCCDNRGVYVKVGQHIGALEYLLPLEYVETMKILHSDAPKNPVEDLFKVIKQDLKKDVYDIFESFESEPLGTASLAQVHKAKLKTGETVAVKVQHPYVKGNSKVDMKTMEILVSIMAKVFPDFKIKWLVDETKINLPIELDFLHEGQNCEKIKEMFKKQFQWLRVPKIYWEHSSSRVLVMEYLEGGHVNDVKYLKDNKLDHFDVSSKIGQLYSEMIFVKGFVHSDPHPGNILVERSSVTGKADIILLDHGLYATLTPKFRYEYSKLWLSILNVDKTAMRKHSENLGIKGDLYGLFACMVTGRPWELVVQGIDRKRITDDEVCMVFY